MGSILGLLGGGGSLLAVPIFVFGFHKPVELATSYSLIVVAVSALIGLVGYSKKGLVRYKEGFLFALLQCLAFGFQEYFYYPYCPIKFSLDGFLYLNRH